MTEDFPDLNEVREFYKPLTGRGGAFIPLPVIYAEVASELAGQKITLRKARQLIKSKIKKIGGYINIRPDYIAIHYPRRWTLQTKVACHIWAIIWHRPITTA